MAKINHLSMDNRLKICREYADLWQSYFSFFSDMGEDMQITHEMEDEFEKTMNVLALNHFKFSELCGDYMEDTEIIISIMVETVSLEVMRDMPEATKSKLFVDWHKAFIRMHKAVGKMIMRLTPKQLLKMQAAGVIPPPAQRAA